MEKVFLKLDTDHNQKVASSFGRPVRALLLQVSREEFKRFNQVLASLYAEEDEPEVDPDAEADFGSYCPSV